MHAWIKRRQFGSTAAFEQTLLARFNEHNAGRKKQHCNLQTNQNCERSFNEQPVKPRFGDFESELVVERLGSGCDKASGCPSRPTSGFV